MRLCSIASGSSGNCIYVGHASTHLLIDAGISGKRIEQGLAEMGVVFYTGHCTSREAFAYLKPILGDNLQNFTVGTVIEI